MNSPVFNVDAVKSMLRRCACGLGRASVPAPRGPARGSHDHRSHTSRSCGFGLLVGIGVERRD